MRKLLISLAVLLLPAFALAVDSPLAKAAEVLPFRALGPGLMSGRIADLAVLTQGDYIKIVDYTGRQFAKGKKGFIRADEKKAFDKLGLNPNHLVHRVKAFGPGLGARWFRFVGELEEFVEKIDELKKRTLFGIGLARTLQKA
jgi:hypothetical protein